MSQHDNTMMTRAPTAHRRHAARRIGGVLAVVVTVLLTCATLAAELRCTTCNKTISGSYLRSERGAYCSKECLLKSLPTCAACGRRLTGKHLKWRGKNYCSIECLEQHLPHCELCGKPLRNVYTINGHAYCERDAKRPTCEACGLPFIQGHTFADGRRACSQCYPVLVLSTKAARPLFLEAQRELEALTGYRSPTEPSLRLVGTHALRERSDLAPAQGMTQRGLYDRHVVVTTTKNVFGKVIDKKQHVRETVYILYGLTPPAFLSTATHELTHDLIAECYPEIARKAPLWVEEGICQYLAAELCRTRGYRHTLAEIASNPDKAYGDGYRYFHRAFGPGHWQDIVRWMETVRTENLPETAPHVP
ncbi:MAG: hypothetical protein K9N51_06740 [Candidatus Pacebacteria bacterium]|nr:hypothetical protein [Candidatus Paceibacterota bacterium]